MNKSAPIGVKVAHSEPGVGAIGIWQIKVELDRLPVIIIESITGTGIWTPFTKFLRRVA